MKWNFDELEYLVDSKRAGWPEVEKKEESARCDISAGRFIKSKKKVEPPCQKNNSKKNITKENIKKKEDTISNLTQFTDEYFQIGLYTLSITANIIIQANSLSIC